MKGRQKQKFTIIIRVRPKIKEDLAGYRQADMQNILQSEPSSINIKRKNNEQKIFRFNHVYNPGEQKQLYERSAHLVQSVFQGHNATFLAYGQTGTGKTHTVFGSEGIESGYFYSSVEDIFATIKKKLNQRQFAVRISFVQFYLDNIFDLLDANSRKLQIKESNQEGIFIKDLTQVSVRSAEELFASMKKAVKNRKTEETSIAQNKRSSRSHAVIQITILQRWNQSGETKYLKAMLKIVDLAGSQRVSKTQSNGNRLQQAKRINKEITTLGKCINLLAIAQKQNKSLSNDLSSRFNFNKSHIPFRDAKITRYLSQSLEGKAKIVLCVCVSKFAIHLQQTFSSLMFATQASTLKVDSIRNQTYTMTVKKSVQKQGYETPLRGKTESKKQQRSSYRQVSAKQPSHSLNKVQGSVRPTSAINGEKLIEKFQKQMSQINSYLQKRQVPTKNQSKQILQANLLAMHSSRMFNIEIFSILRQNNLPTFY